jgi:hypothetical protein
MSDDKFHLGQVLLNIEKMKRELPIQLANLTQQHFVDSFKEEGWEGNKWKTPKRKIEGTPEYKYPKNKGLSRRVKATLNMTGRLRKAVGMSIRVANFQRIQLIVDVPYAKYLNEGTPKMVARTFMKDSSKLRELQRNKIEEYFKKEFPYDIQREIRRKIFGFLGKIKRGAKKLIGY